MTRSAHTAPPPLPHPNTSEDTRSLVMYLIYSSLLCFIQFHAVHRSYKRCLDNCLRNRRDEQLLTYL